MRDLSLPKANLYWIDPTNGNVQFTNALIQSFVKRGFTITVRSTRVDKLPPPSGAGWEDFSTPLPFGQRPELKKIGTGVFYPWDWWRAAHSLRSRSIRSVLVSSRLSLPEMDALGMKFLRMAGVSPVILSHRPRSDYYENHDSGSAKRYRLFYQQSERVVVMSSYNRQLMSEYLGLPPERIYQVPIPHYNDYLETFTPDEKVAEQISQIKGSGPLITLLSHDTPEHGLDNFFNNLPDLQRFMPDARIAVLSRFMNPSRMRTFMNILDTYFSGRYYLHTTFYPYETLLAVTKLTDVAVLPYNWMTQSGAAVLLMGLGIPLVSTRVGGMQEMIIPGETGEFFNPIQKGSLAKAIQRIVTGGCLQAYRDNTSNRARKYYDPALTIRGLLQILSEVAENASSRSEYVSNH